MSVTSWAPLGASMDVPADVPVGSYFVSVVANAIPGGRMTKVVANAPPVANDKSLTTNTNVPVPIVVTGTDPDVGQSLTWAILTPPAHGKLTGTLPDVTYSPDVDYHGPDAFTFDIRDCGQHSNVASVAISVVDPPPDITCPPNMVIEATSSQGAKATWQDAVSTDGPSSEPSVTYVPTKGSTLPLGSTTVKATATDSAGNETSCVFQVIVKDTTAPTLTCPEDMSVFESSADGAIVSFEVPAPTDAVSSPVVTSSPASGSRFPVGYTSVTVTATDAANNAATCTFAVRVSAPHAPLEPPPATVPTDEPQAGDGGGCAVARPASTSSPFALSLAVGLAAFVRRRRRRRTTET